MDATLVGSFWQLVAAGGGGALLVLGALKFFGQKWVDASISRGMEALRHKNVTELEELKFQFQRNLDRRTRIVQIELEILPKLWSMLIDATNKTKAAQVRFRRHADLEKMSQEDFEIWLKDTKLPQNHQSEIAKSAPNERNNLYSRADDIRLCFEARKAAIEANEYLAINSVFVPDELYKELSEFSMLISESALDAELEAVQGRIPKEDRRSDKFWEESNAVIANLSVRVRSLLCDGVVLPQTDASEA